MADLPLADPEEHGHDLLERIALEVEQHEKELGPGRGKRALVPGSRLTLTRLPGVVPAVAAVLPDRVEGDEQPLELTGTQRRERTQQLGFAENPFDVHALAYKKHCPLRYLQ